MVINTNISAMFASRSLDRNGEKLQKDLEKLSSGLKINRAADDAAGLAISEKMRAQINGLQQASRNAGDGVSLIQTAEGYLNETHNLLQRVRVLSVQVANGIYNDADRAQTKVEVGMLIDEVTRISNIAQFNKIKLLDGSLSSTQQAAGQTQQAAVAPAAGQAAPVVAATEGTTAGSPLIFHIGANTDERISTGIEAMNAAALGIDQIDLGNQEGANSAIAVLDNAIDKVSKQRADLGAYQNRLESAIRSLDIGAENLSASNSRILDANMAKESVSYLRDNILSQSTVAMLAQANNKNQSVLQLLR